MRPAESYMVCIRLNMLSKHTYIRRTHTHRYDLLYETNKIERRKQCVRAEQPERSRRSCWTFDTIVPVWRRRHQRYAVVHQSVAGARYFYAAIRIQINEYGFVSVCACVFFFANAHGRRFCGLFWFGDTRTGEHTYTHAPHTNGDIAHTQQRAALAFTTNDGSKVCDVCAYSFSQILCDRVDQLSQLQ